MTLPLRYFVLHKPYGMVSQFVSSNSTSLLGGIPFNFPEGTHAIGRLDKNSEGLLLLTTDKKITALLFQGKIPHKRTYLVQANYEVGSEKILRLRKGVDIRIDKGLMYRTPPCDARIAAAPEQLAPLPFPFYMDLPTTWLELTLEEGRYHQVRKMVTAIGHRTLRLIRTSIEDLELNGLPSGCVKEMDRDNFYALLKL